MFEQAAVQRHLSWGAAIYLWAAAGVACALDTPWLCPQPCQCDPKGLEVNCSERQLTTVLDGIPQDSQVLNLTHNEIKAVTRQQFKNLTQLRDLDLSNNILVMIEVEAFQGLDSLLTLRLDRNRLKVIPVGAFIGLARLQLLDMSHNEILVLLDFTFSGLTVLQRIETGENDLVFVSPQAFHGLTSLQDLHLYRCNLTAVPTEALTQLNGLTSLRFSRLGLTALPNNSFRGLGHLRLLVVSNCPWLETLSVNSLFGLNLTHLTISNCNLSAVPYVPLHHLVYLIYLDLSFNPITSIQGNSLGELLRLQEFHLVGGRLLRIEAKAFHTLAHLSLVNVSGNLLATLEETSFHSAGNLNILRLDNNPLVCDCRLTWVARRRLYFDFGGHPPSCANAIQGRNFLNFSESELSGVFACRRPRILNCKPREIWADDGHTAVFYCKADGDPVPEISWLTPQLMPISSSGRIRALPNGSLEVRYAQVQDGGIYVCVASNAGGNDSFPVRLRIRGFSSASRYPFKLGWFPSRSPTVNETHPFPLDVKTLAVVVMIGFLSFSSSVTICFFFILFWSKGKGQLKRTATIAYVPRTTTPNINGGPRELGRFTMKLI